MILLALDTSVASTGFAIFNEKQEIITYGNIPTEKKDFETEDLRLNYIGNVIDELIRTYNVTDIIEEDQFTSINSKTILLLRKLVGVISRVAYKYEINIHYVQPSQWRAKLGIKGKDKKLAAFNYLKDNNIIDLGELKTSGKKKNDDITDALCIGLSYFK